jgi:fumarate hydratase class II
MIKGAAAAVNLDLGLLESAMAAAIQRAAKEVEDGIHDADFPLDIFQTDRRGDFEVDFEVSGKLRGRAFLVRSGPV